MSNGTNPIGDLIKLRERKGLTRKQVADGIGRPPLTYRNWEQRRNDMPTLAWHDAMAFCRVEQDRDCIAKLRKKVRR